jgi:hypothetical protein
VRGREGEDRLMSPTTLTPDTIVALKHGVDEVVIALARVRVRRGIRFLDKQGKGVAAKWRETLHDRILANHGVLNLANAENCILGLTYAQSVIDKPRYSAQSSGYWFGVKRLFGGSHLKAMMRQSALHGFTTANDRSEGERDPRGQQISFGILQAVWEQELIAEGVVPVTAFCEPVA